jgi:hypothetical protein
VETNNKVAYPAAVEVLLVRLERATGRASVWVLVQFDANVKIVADVLLLLVIAPMLLGSFQRLVK